MTDAAAEILFSHENGIGIITLNRPQARNALTFAMYEDIARIAADPQALGATRALILTGAGDKAFAAGTDIAQFRDFRTPEDALAYEDRIERVLDTLEACPVPTIAAISGAVTGGGAAIAACCDLRIATESARFGFPIARTLGNCLSMRNYARLNALLGPARVKDMIFTARLIEAEEGRSIGLFSEILPDHAALTARMMSLAALIAGHAPLTLRATKESLRRIGQGGDLDDSEWVLNCYLSGDFREGMEAFLAKRPPDWKGR
ncbi:MAG: enoyl-CoA hydratase/isomerase family protein [Rhabdaerophilum sp.]